MKSFANPAKSVLGDVGAVFSMSVSVVLIFVIAAAVAPSTVEYVAQGYCQINCVRLLFLVLSLVKRTQKADL